MLTYVEHNLDESATQVCQLLLAKKRFNKTHTRPGPDLYELFSLEEAFYVVNVENVVCLAQLEIFRIQNLMGQQQSCGELLLLLSL
jgi:hypothetical protein